MWSSLAFWLYRFFLAFVLSVAALLIGSGIVLPALSITHLYFFSTDYSLFDGIVRLYDNGDVWLAAVVFVFTILFPTVKVLLGYAAIVFADPMPSLMRRTLRAVRTLSKWSMLDVFAAALIIVAIDGRVFSFANIQGGALFFTLGIFLSTFVIYGLRRLETGGARR